MMSLLANYLNRTNNNLDLFKLLTAVLIIWNHSFPLSPSPIGAKPYPIFFEYTVPLFAFMAGLTFTNSVIKHNSLIRALIRPFF